MNIRIAGIENDSIVDGVGIRLTIFVQGCPHHCEGCHNPESWDYRGGRSVDVGEIISLMDKNPLLDGITLSGGEPFSYVGECIELAEAAHKRGLNVWCYTGYTYEDLREMPWLWGLLDEVDVLVDGRFEKDKRSLELKFRGSSNQRVIDINETRKNGNISLAKL